MDLHNLRQMTAAQLDELFSHSRVGDLPDGRMDGTVLLAAGRGPESAPVARLIDRYIWHGKTFDAARGVLYNRFPTTHAFSATMLIGPSLYDQADCIVLDYTESPASHVRDELRQVTPGIYLGKAYQRRHALVHFALSQDVRKTTKRVPTPIIR
jgi:hypothetical protein